MRLCLLLLMFLVGCSRGTAAAGAYDAAAQAWMQDNPDAATALLAAARQQGPFPAAEAAALAAQGDYLLRHDDPAGASAAYTEAEQLAPTHPAVLAGRGDEALVAGDAKAALEHYEAALKQDAAFAPALAGLAMLSLQAGDVEAAESWLQDAIAPGATGYEPGVISVMGRIPVERVATHEIFTSWMQSWLEAHPTDIRSHILAGRYYQRLGRGEEALKVLGWAHRQRPDYPGLTRELGLLHFEAGNLQEALKLFRQWHQAAPSADSLHLVAIGLANLQEFDQAYLRFEEGEATWPDDRRFPLGRGQVRYSQGRFDEAYEILRPLGEQEPPLFEALRELGLIEIARKNWQEAARWLDLALAQHPSEPWANFQRGYVAAATGDRAGFESHLIQVLNQGFVTAKSLSGFDNYFALMEIDWAAAWVDEMRIAGAQEK